MVCIREDACLFTAPAIAGKLRAYLEDYVNNSDKPVGQRRDALTLSRCLEICDDPLVVAPAQPAPDKCGNCDTLQQTPADCDLCNGKPAPEGRQP